MAGDFDYERGLEQLKEMLREREPSRLSDFCILEARLLENLQGERLYGSSEARRGDRAQIVDALNDLTSQVGLSTSFNDLCRGKGAGETTTPCRWPPWVCENLSRVNWEKIGALAGIASVIIGLIALIISTGGIESNTTPSYTPIRTSTIPATSPTPAPPYRNFIIHRNNLTIILENGEQITVEPDEPLILNLGTADGTRVPSGVCSCRWDSPAGQIDNSGSCTDVTYQSPGNGTDIVGLTVNNSSVESYQLSLSITVK